MTDNNKNIEEVKEENSLDGVEDFAQADVLGDSHIEKTSDSLTNDSLFSDGVEYSKSGNPYLKKSDNKSINGQNMSNNPYKYGENYHKEKQKRKNRDLLILSAVGLLLSVFIFLGIIFSAMGLIGSARKIKGTKSQVVKWAFAIGVLGFIVNLAMIASCVFY